MNPGFPSFLSPPLPNPIRLLLKINLPLAFSPSAGFYSDILEIKIDFIFLIFNLDFISLIIFKLILKEKYIKYFLYMNKISHLIHFFFYFFYQTCNVHFIIFIIILFEIKLIKAVGIFKYKNCFHFKAIHDTISVYPHYTYSFIILIILSLIHNVRK